MKHYSSYYKRLHVRRIKIAVLAVIVSMFFLPVLKYFISPRYFSGLAVVPIVMAGELFFGVFFYVQAGGRRKKTRRAFDRIDYKTSRKAGNKMKTKKQRN